MYSTAVSTMHDMSCHMGPSWALSLSGDPGQAFLPGWINGFSIDWLMVLSLSSWCQRDFLQLGLQLETTAAKPISVHASVDCSAVRVPCDSPRLTSDQGVCPTSPCSSAMLAFSKRCCPKKGHAGTSCTCGLHRG